jgi:hypothetical protein
MSGKLRSLGFIVASLIAWSALAIYWAARAEVGWEVRRLAK